MIRIGVTGGIGSGKSTVCALLAETGIPVYDSDCRARELMNGAGGNADDASDGGKLRHAIIELLGAEAYDGDVLDRDFVARKVFADKSLLASLNAIVHPAVAKDFEAWAAAVGTPTADKTASETRPAYLILESAILFESGFDALVDRTITVSASETTRIERVVARGNRMGRNEVMARMGNQMTDAERNSRADYVIDNNGGRQELAAEVKKLDNLLKHK